MKHHPRIAKVQEEACRALRNLSVNAENQGTISNLGGIEALLKAMKDHPTHPGVQEEACWALGSLAVEARIARLGGIEAILTAMKEHPTIAVVQERACFALKNLADRPVGEHRSHPQGDEGAPSSPWGAGAGVRGAVQPLLQRPEQGEARQPWRRGAG